MTLYKVLATDGSSYHGGSLLWSLPRDGQPGGWMPKIEGQLIPCRRGYHLLRRQDVVLWLGPTLWQAETADLEPLVCHDKLIVSTARLLSTVETWDDRLARRFACDCVERALMREREAGREPDARSWAAIHVSRRYSNGTATVAELEAAQAEARGATREAALATREAALATREAALATRGTAMAAGRAWEAALAARGAAMATRATREAALAAREAVWAAGGMEAERLWQTQHLMVMLGLEEEPERKGSPSARGSR